MNIASSKLDQLAERLARLTGENVETALERAVEEKLARVETAPASERQSALRTFFDRVSLMPVLDERSDDEIIGYDGSGLPS
jgi:antitoxin VapB